MRGTTDKRRQRRLQRYNGRATAKRDRAMTTTTNRTDDARAQSHG